MNTKAQAMIVRKFYLFLHWSEVHLFVYSVKGWASLVFWKMKGNVRRDGNKARIQKTRTIPEYLSNHCISFDRLFSSHKAFHSTFNFSLLSSSVNWMILLPFDVLIPFRSLSPVNLFGRVQPCAWILKVHAHCQVLFITWFACAEAAETDWQWSEL